MVINESWLRDGNKISFHWLKENTKEEVVLRDNMEAQDRVENDKGSSNSETIVQQGEKSLEVHYTSDQMNVAMEKGIQTKMF